jgi:hypothetical protein
MDQRLSRHQPSRWTIGERCGRLGNERAGSMPLVIARLFQFWVKKGRSPPKNPPRWRLSTGL